MAKRSKAFGAVVLRSGSAVSLDGSDVARILDHLQKAILRESITAVARTPRKSWNCVVDEIVAEIAHLTRTMRPDVTRGLLAVLLAQAVIERLRDAAGEHDLRAPVARKIQ